MRWSLVLISLAVGAGCAAQSFAPEATIPRQRRQDRPSGIDNLQPVGELVRHRSRGRRGSPGMVLIPEGAFLRGSPVGVGNPSEQPQRSLWLGAFWIDRLEVKTDDYRSCVNAGACATPALTEALCNWSLAGHGDHPINCVSWGQAEAYCKWVGKRLPTEAEWEKAARGTDGRTYPWGEAAATCERACMSEGNWGCGDGGTCPVGKYPSGASPFGLQDMAGNVWEWTADYFGEDYYAAAPPRDPGGPVRGTRRSVRGGGYGMGEDGPRCANRDGGFTHDYDGGDAVGFRCAR